MPEEHEASDGGVRVGVGVQGFAWRVLRNARKRADLTQADLATELGVHTSAVGFWENGESSPTPKHLVRLALLLGVTTDDLIRTPRAEATLAGLRERAGITATEMARKVGVGKTKYSSIERALDELTVPQVSALALALDISTTEVSAAWQRARQARTRQTQAKLSER